MSALGREFDIARRSESRPSAVSPHSTIAMVVSVTNVLSNNSSMI